MGQAGGKNKARSKVGTRRNKNVNSVNALHVCTLPREDPIDCQFINY